MRLHKFIFSEEKKIKLLRHLAFWGGCWLYFLFCFWLYQLPAPSLREMPRHVTPGENLPLNTLLLVSLFALACYPLIYLIFPKFINRKSLLAAVYFILLCSLLFFAVHFIYWNVFSSVGRLGGAVKSNKNISFYWPATNIGLLNFAKVAAAAVIIKYIKYWWLKQKESQRLEKEKLNAELQLLKAQVQPDFLFKTLTNIYDHSLSSSPQTSGMLLKLSDLLSYMLYECDQPLVPLKREIEMMKEYIQLEKLRYNNGPEIEVDVKGDLEGKAIAPFLLLPFIEHSFKQSTLNTEQAWINLNILVENNHFSMKLINGISEKNPETVKIEGDELLNAQKRLALLYADQHEIKITVEQEMFIVFLNINLDNSIVRTDKSKNSPVLINPKIQPVALNYVSE